MEQIKTWERPSEAPGAASSFNLSVCRSVGQSLAHSVLPLSWEKKEKTHTAGHEWIYSKREFVKFEEEIILSMWLTPYYPFFFLSSSVHPSLAHPFTHIEPRDCTGTGVCVSL